MKTKPLDLQSIFPRLLISMMLVVLPVIIGGILMFNWGKQAIRSEIENNARTNVTLIRKNLEDEIQNIMQLQYDLTEDQLLKKIIISSSLPSYEYYSLISNLQIRLSVMQNSHKLIQDVSVYYPGMKQMISVNNGYEPINPAQYSHLQQLALTAKYPLSIDQGVYRTCIVYPSRIFESEATLYLIALVLRTDNLRTILVPANDYSGGFTALYDYTSLAWVLCTGDDRSPDISRYTPAAEAPNAIVAEQVSLAGKIFYAVKGFSKDLNLSVVEFIPMQDIFRIPNTYGRSLWFYTVIAAAVLALYAYLTHRAVKRPLDRIVDAFQRLDQGDLEVQIKQKAASEFNYLYDEFNNMVLCLNTLINNDYKQKIMAQKAELKQLQSQINPHFLLDKLPANKSEW